MRIRAVLEEQLLPARNILACTQIGKCNFDTDRKATQTKKTFDHRFSEKLKSRFLMAMLSLTQKETRYRQTLHANPGKCSDCPAHTDIRAKGWLEKNGSGVFLEPHLA
jgi:hypothetical protein